MKITNNNNNKKTTSVNRVFANYQTFSLYYIHQSVLFQNKYLNADSQIKPSETACWS